MKYEDAARDYRIALIHEHVSRGENIPERLRPYIEEAGLTEKAIERKQRGFYERLRRDVQRHEDFHPADAERELAMLVKQGESLTDWYDRLNRIYHRIPMHKVSGDNRPIDDTYHAYQVSGTPYLRALCKLDDPRVADTDLYLRHGRNRQ